MDDTRWDGEADYLVLGAGSAGSVLADRLTEDGRHRVLLVEAGPEDRNPFIHVPAGFLQLIDNPTLSWRYQAEDPAGRTIAVPQGRMLGGTGSLNGMLYVRSSRSEHAAWVNQGCTGWSFDEVLPYYRKVENVDGAAPDHPLPVSRFLECHPLSQAFLDACAESGLPLRDSLNGPEREGAALFHQNRLGRFRRGPAQTYLRRARGRANLQVMTQSLVHRIVFEGRRAVGAEVQGPHGWLRLRARKEVIVACGAIRSPHLLQLSGVGPGALLQSLGIPIVAEQDSVGENLRDHYSVRLTQRVAGMGTLNERTRGLGLAGELLKYVLFGRGLLTTGASSAAVFARSTSTRLFPDLQLSFAPGSFEPGTYRLERKGGMTINVYHSFPDSRGTVQARTADAADAPAIRPGYLTAPADEAVLLAGLRLARRIFSMPALRRWSVQETLPGPAVESDEDLLRYARENGVCGYHLVGTCRMGGGADAVVDERLRVRGVQGLRVIDASVLPTGTSGNSNAPTLMTAEKGAAMVLEDLLEGG